MKREAQAYMNPYVAGVGLGLVLLAAFVVFGRGLGASGAFSSAVAAGVRGVAPLHEPANAFYNDYAGSPLREWLVIEILGVFAGGFLSAWRAGRLLGVVEKGARITARSRLALAFGGGAVMGIGAKLARGCTSGLGLTGGALLSVGSWLFILTAFAAAYALAPAVRKAWQ